MLPDLDLRLVRYFLVVAEQLNFARAAEQLRVAQPSLSRQIQRLENALGIRLLERLNGWQLGDLGRLIEPAGLSGMGASGGVHALDAMTRPTSVSYVVDAVQDGAAPAAVSGTSG